MDSVLKGLACYKEILISSEDHNSNEEKQSFFLEKHSTKEGTWGHLQLQSGTFDFVFLDGAGQELSRHKINPEKPQILIPPSAWHKIVPTGTSFSATLSFYCRPHRYFNKKHGLGNVHGDLLHAYQTYLQTEKNMNILDIGCGSGRNLLYMALAGHQVMGADINQPALEKINAIAQQENLSNVTTATHDLHQPMLLADQSYDLVVSTVSLQFLEPQRIPSLLQELQQATKAGGKHVLVFPVGAAQFELPASFKYLPESKELYHFYQDSGWSILEYTESTGTLHRLDERGRPIQGLFGFLVAQKIH